jgi:hypothetical protein
MTLSDFQLFNHGVVACRKISQTAKDFSQATKLLSRAHYDSTIPLCVGESLPTKSWTDKMARPRNAAKALR